MHLADDVAASHELPIDVELWDCRPVGERLDSVPDLGGAKYIDRFVAWLQLIENFHDLGGEPALRPLASSLHEEDDPSFRHEVGDLLVKRLIYGHGCAFQVVLGAVKSVGMVRGIVIAIRRKLWGVNVLSCISSTGPLMVKL